MSERTIFVVYASYWPEGSRACKAFGDRAAADALCAAANAYHLTRDPDSPAAEDADEVWDAFTARQDVWRDAAPIPEEALHCEDFFVSELPYVDDEPK